MTIIINAFPLDKDEMQFTLDLNFTMLCEVPDAIRYILHYVDMDDIYSNIAKWEMGMEGRLSKKFYNKEEESPHGSNMDRGRGNKSVVDWHITSNPCM